MDEAEMKVYIETLEKENNTLKIRNDKLYELNCNQAHMLSVKFNDHGYYENRVAKDDFKYATYVYNNYTASKSSTTSNYTISPIVLV